MGKIFCLIGKSSSGKDTIYKQIMKEKELPLSGVIPYTTRPMRLGEENGREYYFTDEERLKTLEAAEKVIELRSYQTVHGIWKYFTADDGQINLKQTDYLMIATLEAYMKIRDYFGKASVLPVYVEAEDGLRLQRALERERLEAEPRYAEMCRRFLADAQDFSEEKLKAAGIDMRFENEDLKDACRQITSYIKECSGWK